MGHIYYFCKYSEWKSVENATAQCCHCRQSSRCFCLSSLRNFQNKTGVALTDVGKELQVSFPWAYAQSLDFTAALGKKSYKEDQSLATFFFSRIIWFVCIIARLIFTHRSFKETATAFPSLGKSLSKAPGSIFALQVKQERQWNAACEKTRFRITEESKIATAMLDFLFVLKDSDSHRCSR